MVKVKYHGVLIKLTKKEEDEFNAKNLKDLLNEIKRKYGKETYKYAKMSYIMINEINASSLNGYKSILKNSDVVELLPVCGGG